MQLIGAGVYASNGLGALLARSSKRRNPYSWMPRDLFAIWFQDLFGEEMQGQHGPRCRPEWPEFHYESPRKGIAKIDGPSWAPERPRMTCSSRPGTT